MTSTCGSAGSPASSRASAPSPTPHGSRSPDAQRAGSGAWTHAMMSSDSASVRRSGGGSQRGPRGGWTPRAHLRRGPRGARTVSKWCATPGWTTCWQRRRVHRRGSAGLRSGRTVPLRRRGWDGQRGMYRYPVLGAAAPARAPPPLTAAQAPALASVDWSSSHRRPVRCRFAPSRSGGRRRGGRTYGSCQH